MEGRVGGVLDRYTVVYKVIKPFLFVYFFIRYNVRFVHFKPMEGSKPPYLVFCNHVSDWDPFFIAFCFPFPVFFVASDHLFRLGFKSRLFRFLVAPIPIQKTKKDVRTIRDMMAYLQKGRSVCVFAEGNRSWSGQTEPIPPTIGRMVQLMDATLLLCRIRGGYLMNPRWGHYLRRGRVDCRVVREVTPQGIAAMDVEAINALIQKELFVDAMADQAQNPIAYHGKAPAEDIETLLYACPECGCFQTIHSQGEKASCSFCGLTFTFSPYGKLPGTPFETVGEWNKWQHGHLRAEIEKRLRDGDTDKLFFDRGQLLYSFERAKKSRLVDKGTFAMYLDKFVFEAGGKKQEFYFNKTADVSVIGRMRFQFTLTDGSSYEVKSELPRSAYLYLKAYELITRL